MPVQSPRLARDDGAAGDGGGGLDAARGLSFLVGLLALELAPLVLFFMSRLRGAIGFLSPPDFFTALLRLLRDDNGIEEMRLLGI